MRVIGLTGGVGTGKSTVARMFERLGGRVLDADRIAHELMEPGSAVHRKIRTRFGRALCGPDGRIDRGRLARRVFRRARELEALCRIIHPAVHRRIRESMRRIRREDSGAVVVLDVPLLLEARPAYRTDALVVVSAPRGAVARRLRGRSGWSMAEIQRRSRFQMPLSEKVRHADFIVENGGSRNATRRQVLAVWRKIGEGVHGRRKDH